MKQNEAAMVTGLNVVEKKRFDDVGEVTHYIHMIPSPLLPTSPGCLAYTLLHQAGVAITATRPSNMSLKRPRTTTLAIFIGFFALNLPVATAELRAAARVTRREAELNFDDDGPTSTTGSVRSAALVRASSLQIFRARKTCELLFRTLQS